MTLLRGPPRRGSRWQQAADRLTNPPNSLTLRALAKSAAVRAQQRHYVVYSVEESPAIGVGRDLHQQRNGTRTVATGMQCRYEFVRPGDSQVLWQAEIRITSRTRARRARGDARNHTQTGLDMALLCRASRTPPTQKRQHYRTPYQDRRVVPMLAITNTFEHSTYDIRWLTMDAGTGALISATRAEPGNATVGQAAGAALRNPPKGWIASLRKDITAIWPSLDGYGVLHLEPKSKSADDGHCHAGLIAPHRIDNEDAHSMLIALETSYQEHHANGRL